MAELIQSLFMLCMIGSVPNPYTVSNLPEYQQELILKEHEYKCKVQVLHDMGLDEVYAPVCRERIVECM